MSKKRKNTYFQELEQKRMFAANQGFMRAILDQPFAFRWKFGWEIIKKINPMTGKRHKVKR